MPLQEDNKIYLPDVDDTNPQQAILKRCEAVNFLGIFNPWYIFGVPDNNIHTLIELEAKFTQLRKDAIQRGLYIKCEPYLEIIDESYQAIKLSIQSENSPSTAFTATQQLDKKFALPFAGNPYTFRVQQFVDKSLPEPPSLIAANNVMKSYHRNDFCFRTILGGTLGLTLAAGIVYLPAIIPIAATGIIGMIITHLHKKRLQSNYRQEINSMCNNGNTTPNVSPQYGRKFTLPSENKDITEEIPLISPYRSLSASCSV